MADHYAFPTTLHDPAIEALLQRVRGEFREMPGLQVTTAQAARLFGIDPALGEQVQTHLVDRRDLTRDANGRHRRHDEA
jgi:hypothetical protein